tara:strand:- start:101 stop:541 length:441 start_codon:yes stop_codon:yes gene_type:complete
MFLDLMDELRKSIHSLNAELTEKIEEYNRHLKEAALDLSLTQEQDAYYHGLGGALGPHHVEGPYADTREIGELQQAIRASSTVERDEWAMETPEEAERLHPERLYTWAIASAMKGIFDEHEREAEIEREHDEFLAMHEEGGDDWSR